MPEVVIPIKSYVVKYACPKCGEYMEWGGGEFSTIPPQYPHFCPKCGYKETFRNRHYPFFAYEAERPNKRLHLTALRGLLRRLLAKVGGR